MRGRETGVEESGHGAVIAGRPRIALCFSYTGNNVIPVRTVGLTSKKKNRPKRLAILPLLPFGAVFSFISINLGSAWIS